MFIRQNATHKVVIGPFVDVGDGFTPETGITLGAADEAEALVHDSGTVVDISGYTWAAITTMDGYYNLTLQSGISGTVGHMIVVVQDDDVCLPVRAQFTVLEEAVYDALFAASANAFTGAAGSSTVALLTATQASIDAIETDTGTTLQAELDGIQADTEDIQTQIGTAGAGLTDLGGMSTGMKGEINTEVDTAFTTTLADSVPADGSLPTREQAIYMITQFLLERSVSSTTVTVKKVDGSTSLMTFTLDDATNPTSITRAT